MTTRVYLLIIICAIAGCSAGNFNMGYETIVIPSKATMTDTFTVRLSTVKIDSLATNGTKTALVGKYENSNIGSLETRHYFNVDRSANIGNLKTGDDVDVFDSLTVRLKYSRYFVGDTISPVTLNLSRLVEGKRLQLVYDAASSTGSLYNTTSFPVDPAPLGSYTFLPRPISEDTIEFRISDVLGKEMMQKFISGSTDVENNENFNRYMRGFMLSGGQSNLILGFSTDSVMLKLYTHAVDLYNTRKSYEFMVAAERGTTHYNQAIADRNGSPFIELTGRMQHQEILSPETGNKTYLQGTSGVITRVDFPTINNIFQSYKSAFNAHLFLYVQTGDLGVPIHRMDQLPDSLFIYSSGAANVMKGDPLLSSSNNPVIARLNRDKSTPENSFYFADITNYLVGTLLNGYYDTSIGLLITTRTLTSLTGLFNSVDYAILRGENTDNYSLRPRLDLYVLTYEQNDN